MPRMRSRRNTCVLQSSSRGKKKHFENSPERKFSSLKGGASSCLPPKASICFFVFTAIVNSA